MSAVQARARLVRAAKELKSRWLEVQESWQDEQCHQFEKKVMEPLETDMRMAMLAMERIEGLMARAQSDCRNREEM
jgi:hypothetical protein